MGLIVSNIFWSVYEQNRSSIENNVCVDDQTAESVIIASNAKWNELKEKEWHLLLFYIRWKNTADLVTRWFKLLVTETRLFHRKLPPYVLVDSFSLFCYHQPTKLWEGNVLSRVDRLWVIQSTGRVLCDHYPWCIGPHRTGTSWLCPQPLTPRHVETCSTLTSFYRDPQTCSSLFIVKHVRLVSMRAVPNGMLSCLYWYDLQHARKISSWINSAKYNSAKRFVHELKPCFLLQRFAGN